MEDQHGHRVIGYRLSTTSGEYLGQPIDLRSTDRDYRLQLHLVHTLDLDETGNYLKTFQNTYTLQTGDTNASIVAYEYVRDIDNQYPEAHLHVHGGLEALQLVFKTFKTDKRKLSDIHFSVGGRRFRPCLEDLIELCVNEKLVKPHDNWEKALDKSRNQYYKTQLEAAVRADTDTVAEALRNAGWKVEAPKKK